MNKPIITLVANDFGYLGPLAGGEVEADRIELILDRTSPISKVKSDPAIDGGEISFSAYLILLSQGDCPFVGLPIFAYWAFRHRCFYVLRDSPLKDLPDLVGKRIGTNAWPDTGNTWTRAALREAGVSLDQVEWWVGPVEDPAYDSWAGRPEIRIPDNVHAPPAGRTIWEMLLGGEVDALMYPLAPKAFYDKDSPIVRLLPNYREAERAYYRRTGIFPGHHIIGLRRQVFEGDPWIARSLFRALDESKQVWLTRRKRFAETTPWMLVDIEETMDLIGEDWMPNGVAANQRMIQALCDEEYEQGMTDRRLDASEVFAEFMAVMDDD